MICEKCKKEVPEGSKICPFCGYEMEGQDKADTAATGAPTQDAAVDSGQNMIQEEPHPTSEPLSMAGMPTVQQPEKKKNKKLKIGIIAAAVILVLAIAIPVSLTAIKTYNYNQAVGLLKAEKYEQAKKILGQSFFSWDCHHSMY